MPHLDVVLDVHAESSALGMFIVKYFSQVLNEHAHSVRKWWRVESTAVIKGCSGAKFLERVGIILTPDELADAAVRDGTLV